MNYITIFSLVLSNVAIILTKEIPITHISNVEVKIKCKDPPTCNESVLTIKRKDTNKHLIPPITLSKRNEKKPKTRSDCTEIYHPLEPSLESIEKNEIVAIETCDDKVTRGVITYRNKTIQLKYNSKTDILEAIQTEYSWKKIFTDDSITFDREKINASRQAKNGRMKFSPRKSFSGIYEIEILALVDKISATNCYRGVYDEEFLRKNIESTMVVVQQKYNGTGFLPILKKIIFLDEEEYHLNTSSLHELYDAFMSKTIGWQRKTPEWGDYDLILWLTYLENDDFVLGVAGQDSICSEYSASIVQLCKRSTAKLITHEIGHPLTIQHDDGIKTKCYDKDSLMFSSYEGMKYWSECSKQQFEIVKKDKSLTACMMRTDVHT